MSKVVTEQQHIQTHRRQVARETGLHVLSNLDLISSSVCVVYTDPYFNEFKNINLAMQRKLTTVLMLCESEMAILLSLGYISSAT